MMSYVFWYETIIGDDYWPACLYPCILINIFSLPATNVNKNSNNAVKMFFIISWLRFLVYVVARAKSLAEEDFFYRRQRGKLRAVHFNMKEFGETRTSFSRRFIERFCNDSRAAEARKSSMQHVAGNLNASIR